MCWLPKKAARCCPLPCQKRFRISNGPCQLRDRFDRTYKFRGVRMLRRQVMAGLALLMIAVAGYGQTSLASTKSYDLYSWKIKGHWYYSILPHSNGARSY